MREADAPVLLDLDARGVATLTLNRPDAGNRYDPPMLASLAASLASLGSDPAVRCVVLRGAGRHFCVGADVNWHAGQGEPTPPAAGEGFIDVLLALDSLPKPVIAVVQGACVGGGLAFAACCDVVLAATASFFSVPEVRLGFAAESLVPLFQRAIGARAVRRYALSGERFTAAVAQSLGLVSEVFEPGFEAAVLDPLLEAMLLGGPSAQARTKSVSVRCGGADLAGEMRRLEAGFGAALRTPEAAEGIAAFRERRRPGWAPGPVSGGAA